LYVAISLEMATCVQIALLNLKYKIDSWYDNIGMMPVLI
jgi:hypothetical protein